MKELQRDERWYEIKHKKYVKKKAILAKEKVNNFKKFIKHFRRESLQILQKRSREILKELQRKKCKIVILKKEANLGNYKKYVAICRKITEIVINQDKIDVTGRSFKSVHIDHIIPVYHAYKMNLSPYLIAMSGNLQKISKEDNVAKGMYQYLLTN